MRNALLVVLASCSVFMPPVPEWKIGDPPPACTVHPVPPAIDLAIATALLGFGVALEIENASCTACEFEALGAIMIGGATVFGSGGFAWSGVDGISDNRRCKAAHAAAGMKPPGL